MKETLSVLMDDQADRAECDRCLDRLKDDAGLRESWELYHLIGDVLRGTNGTVLPESLAARLADEPTILAPRTSPERAAPHSPLRYALPIAAGIAAVAFVAWVSLPQLQPSSVLQARTTAPVMVSSTPVVPVAHDVGDYLLAHQRFSPSSAMSGVAPYVRTVSETGPAR